MEEDITHLESKDSEPIRHKASPPGWLQVGAIAAASAFAGGIAAAWWYRKTLSKLQQAAEIPQNSNFSSQSPDSPEED